MPLVAYEQELELMRALMDRVVEEEGGTDLRLLIGTMIELPRACFVADRIALRADFFSFGTNDLTQTAIGFSRDDVGGAMLKRYMQEKIVERSPFETIDTPGVGWLVRLAAWVGREAKPDLKLGICGEHGGDPDSIAFFQLAGLDYVSCSPIACRSPAWRRRGHRGIGSAPRSSGLASSCEWAAPAPGARHGLAPGARARSSRLLGDRITA